MKLYMVRHGESEANKENRHAGWAPVHLTEKGIEDAKKAGQIIKDIKFDKVFSSDLVRVVETCFYAIGEDKQEQRSELRELNVGSLAGQYPKILMEQEGEPYIERFKNRNYRYYGGESMDDLYARVVNFMQMLEQQPYSEMDKVLAFSSEGAIDMALGYVLGKDASIFKKISCDNGSVNIFEFKNNEWSLVKWNYSTNL